MRDRITTGSRAMWALMGLLIVVGGFVRISTTHGDPTALAQFLSQALIPAVPGIWAWTAGRRAARHAQNASTAAQDASTAAQDAATNTNGKLDIRFTALGNKMTALAGRMDQHLQYHADHDGPS